MHAIGTLIDKDGDGSIGAGVRNKPGHGLHDERGAHDYAYALWIAVYSSFGKYRAVIEPHELHETDLAYALINHALHFLERRLRRRPLPRIRPCSACPSRLPPPP